MPSFSFKKILLQKVSVVQDTKYLFILKWKTRENKFSIHVLQVEPNTVVLAILKITSRLKKQVFD